MCNYNSTNALPDYFNALAFNSSPLPHYYDQTVSVIIQLWFPPSESIKSTAPSEIVQQTGDLHYFIITWINQRQLNCWYWFDYEKVALSSPLERNKLWSGGNFVKDVNLIPLRWTSECFNIILIGVKWIRAPFAPSSVSFNSKTINGHFQVWGFYSRNRRFGGIFCVEIFWVNFLSNSSAVRKEESKNCNNYPLPRHRQDWEITISGGEQTSILL